MKSSDGVGSDSLDPRAFGFTKAAYRVSETLALLSIGRTSLYAAIQRGELRSVKLGRRTLFLADDLAKFLIGLRDQQHFDKDSQAPQSDMGAPK